MTIFNINIDTKHQLHLDKLIPGLGAGIWNIAEVIEQRAARQPAALAVILPDRILSYRELATAIQAVSHTLIDNGVRAGQIYGVSMGQTVLHLVTLLALARLNAVAVPVHYALPAERRRLVANRFKVTAVLSGRENMRLEGWPFISLNGVSLTTKAAALPPSHSRAEDPCWITLSSGTTGDPKGVMRSHGHMLDRVLKSTFERTRQSRLMPLDLNFGVGFGQAMRMLVLGGTVVLVPDMQPANLAYMARAHAITHWLLSPSLAEDILALLEDDDIHFPSLAYLQIVGATPSRRLTELLMQRFTEQVYVSYGTSEIGPIATADPDILRRAPVSAGQLSPWLKLELVDTEDRPVATGETGRMRVRLDQMFDGYHGAPDVSATRFRDGWHYTGDRARMDTEGLLYIEGREDDVFNAGGSRGWYHDVDSAFEIHPAVREAAAFLLPQSDGHSVLAVAVIKRSSVSASDLLAWGAYKLGPVHPEKIVFVTTFERTATGKVLRERLGKTEARQI